MIAIVDGGSTKCDWVILDHSGKISQKTETLGFNPNIINADLIPQEIEKNQHLYFLKEHLKEIYFYQVHFLKYLNRLKPFYRTCKIGT